MPHYIWSLQLSVLCTVSKWLNRVASGHCGRLLFHSGTVLFLMGPLWHQYLLLAGSQVVGMQVFSTLHWLYLYVRNNHMIIQFVCDNSYQRTMTMLVYKVCTKRNQCMVQKIWHYASIALPYLGSHMLIFCMGVYLELHRIM